MFIHVYFLFADAKRLIGRRYDEPEVQSDIKHWPFAVVNDNGKPKIKVCPKTDQTPQNGRRKTQGGEYDFCLQQRNTSKKKSVMLFLKTGFFFTD